MAAAAPGEGAPAGGAGTGGSGEAGTADDSYKIGENALDAAAALKADEEDEAMRRYKASLGITADGVGGKLEVTVHSMTITPDDGHDAIVIPLGSPGERAAASGMTLQVKEGVGYVMSLQYSVAGNPVLGMRFIHKVSRLGMNVSTDDVMLGGYAARKEPYEYAFPPDAWPSGMFARSAYAATVEITDEEGNEWVKFPYELKIAKGWTG